MTAPAYRYSFVDDRTFTDAEESLRLALLAAEGIYGAARILLNVRMIVTPSERTMLISDNGDESQAVNRSLTQFLMRECGPDQFEVDRVCTTTPEFRAGIN